MPRKEPHIPFQDELDAKNPAGKQQSPGESVPDGGESAQASSDSGWDQSSTRFNVRFALVALLIAGCVGGLMHLLHSIQVKRSADILQSRATKHHSEGNLREAIRYQKQYVEFVPDQVEPLVALSGMLEEAADQPRDWLPVFLTNERILRQDPSRNELRYEQIKVALAIGRMPDARVHINHLLNAAQKKQNDALPASRNGELFFLLAMSYELENNFAEAAKHYRSSIDQGFQSLEWLGRTFRVLDAYVRLAELNRSRLADPQAAADVLDEMVRKHPQSFESYLARATNKLRDDADDDARLDVEKAAEIAPDHPDVVLLQAQLFLERIDRAGEDAASIRRRLERAISSHPENHRLYAQLAQLEQRADEPELAIEVLRRGIARSAGSSELVWLLADQLISTGDLDGARRQIGRLREQDAAGTFIDYLEARILKQQGELLQAKNRLEQVQTRAADQPHLAELSALQLADCHMRMGNYEEQLDAARKVLADQPHSISAQLIQAAALRSLGRLDDALEKYVQLRNIPEARIQAAQIVLEKALQQPDEQRDWTAVERAIDAAERAAADPAEIRLLRFQVAQARGETADSPHAAEPWEGTGPTAARAWAVRIQRALESGRRDEARELLDEAEKQTGDRVELRLARAAFWSSLSGDEAAHALRNVESDLPELSQEDEARLFEALARIHVLRGDQAEAHRVWKTFAGRQPYHLGAQFNRFLFALRTDDADDVRQALDRMRDIEGADGPQVTCSEVIQLMQSSAAPDREAIEQARRRLQKVAERRPNWFLVPLCFARIDEVQGRTAPAARNYRRAIELGLTDPAIVLRTSQLLVSINELDQARRLIDQLIPAGATNFRAPRQRIAAQIALRQGDAERALAEARAIIADDSSAADYVWLGQLQAALGKTSEAEESLQKAIDLTPSHADAHVALVKTLAGTKQMERAGAAMQHAKQQLPEESSDLPLAACYEALGQVDQAAEHYQAAVNREPDRADLAQLAAAFYLRNGRTAEAEPLLERLAEKETTPLNAATWARRSLAAIIGRRDYPSFMKAVQLLDANIEQGENKELERLAKARLMATRPEPVHRRVAVRLLVDIERDTRLSAADQMLLAHLYDGFGEPSRANERWSSLLAGNGENVDVLIAYIQRQLSLGRHEDLAERISELEKREPASARTVALQARVGIVEGRAEDVVTLLNEYVDGSPLDAAERTTRLATVARLLDALCREAGVDDGTRTLLSQEAEQRYREVIELRPDDLLAFATFLGRDGRDGRLAEALDVCRRAFDQSPPLEVTVTAVSLLRMCGASQEKDHDQILRVQSWLEEFVTDEPPQALELLQRAELLDIQGQFDDMEQTYRRILAESERNFIALNNLAWFLSVRHGQHTEAERLINQAIETVGFIPALLDTRGTIQLNQNRIDEAVDTFQEAVAMEDTPPRRFRLATALFKAKNLSKAREQLKLAEERGLALGQLHPLEHAEYHELVETLKRR